MQHATISVLNLKKNPVVTVKLGAPLEMIAQIEEYEPFGVCNTVENILTNLGFNAPLIRKGPNNWSVKKGVLWSIFLIMKKPECLSAMFSYVPYLKTILENFTILYSEKIMILKGWRCRSKIRISFFLCLFLISLSIRILY